MSKKQISPFGCKDCKHVFVDRCGLTGHKVRWHVNAKHHCEEFQRVKRTDGDIRPVARASDTAGDGRPGDHHAARGDCVS